MPVSDGSITFGPSPSPSPRLPYRVQSPTTPQAHYMADPNTMHGPTMTPTDLASAFHTMQLQPPDNTWYMDTASTNHLTNDAGNISHLFSLSKPRSILVGNGHHVPIHGHGSLTLSSPDRPYFLKQVYHVPHIFYVLVFLAAKAITPCLSYAAAQSLPFSFFMLMISSLPLLPTLSKTISSTTSNASLK